MTDDLTKKLKQLKQALDQGILDADTYASSLAGLGLTATQIEATLSGNDNLVVQDSTLTSGDRSLTASRVGGDAMTGDHARKIEAGIYVENRVPASDDPADLRRAYLERVMERAGFLSLAGIDPKLAASNESDARLSLSAVYTALLTSAADQHEQLRPERGEARLSALHQLNRHARLVLLGDPGSGKSTFVNFVALCLAGENLGHPHINLPLLTEPLPDDDGQASGDRQPWEHPPLLPVPVVLRDFAARGLPPVGETATAQHLYDFIMADLRSGALAAYVKPLTQTLLRQGGLLLLDGLDEVPEADQRRVQIKQAVTDFAATFKRCRILVTSRTYAYQRQDWRLPGFAETGLAPFSRGQINRFVERWYAHMIHQRGLAETDAQGRAELLKRAIFGSDRLTGLAERPLLLTLMASLHAWRGGNLPEKREELYADAVDLLLDTWETRKVKRDAQGRITESEPSLTEWLRVDRDAVRGLLNRLAFEAHSGQPEMVGTADVPEGDLVSGLLRLSPQRDLHPGHLVDYLNHRAGLLLPRGAGVYTFPHRTFQEYLAACHLTGTDEDYPDQVAELARNDPNRWREVALLAGAKAARGTASAIWLLIEALCYRSPDKAVEADAWGALLAGQSLVETASLQHLSERNQPKVSRVRRWLTHILAESLLPAVERAAAGRTLAHLGDDRPGVGLRSDGLPDIIWCDVPAGPFLFGEDKQEVTLPAFQISRYPITNAQFDAFVQDGGYTERWRSCWTEAGWSNKGDQQKPHRYVGIYDLPNHPVVAVSWYEAVAFCRWLTQRLQAMEELAGDQEISLPTDSQWEKAARGTDGRKFPWGEQIDPERCNYGETGIGTTSAVGCFAKGASPYDSLDMSGNVWEWCRSKHNNLQDNALEGDAARVLRGGAFNDSDYVVRCAARYRNDPYYRNISVGFRVVVSPFNSDL